MSAIWGCIDLSDNDLPEGLCAAMERPLHEYRIDRYASISTNNVVMGCGVQYTRKWSEKEPLPIHDAKSDVYFTADACIFNRDELIGELCPENNGIPDGELMFLAFRAWGADCSKRIYGSYSFAAYDAQKNELVISADHRISRSIYYFCEGSRVYFSTLTSPIREGCDAAPQLNDEWCALFLAMRSYAVMVDGIHTPYNGIFRIPAAHYYVFSGQVERKIRYWFPDKVSPLRLNNDDEYAERFRTLFDKCTRETLQASGKVGAQLSSGFDSGSVAAYSARILEERGEPLLSYTHVPIDAFSKENTQREVFNEKEGVERFCTMHSNIVPRFLSTPDKNGVLSLPEIMLKDFFPIKSITNIGWIDGIMEEMAHDGCRVLLSGQYGNVTISRGSVDTYFTMLLSKGKIVRFLKELNNFTDVMKLNRKRVLKKLLTRFTPVFLQRLKVGDYLRDTLVNRDYAALCGINKKDRRLERNLNIHKRNTLKRENESYYEDFSLAQISDYETKLTLFYGLQSFDITKDPRIIEFCCSLPLECFTNAKPESRRLTRVYLADNFPPEVLPELSPRGTQSADEIERLIPVWEQAYEELTRVCLSPQMCRMADADKVGLLLERLKTGPDQVPSTELNRLLYIYSMGIFLEQHISNSGI